jgi:Ca2+-binding EF-hand superfamily protein
MTAEYYAKQRGHHEVLAVLLKPMMPKFMEIFSWFDADGDGSITNIEFASAMRKFFETFDGIPGDQKEAMLESVESMSQQMFDADGDGFDDNGNGTLEFPEFLKWLDQVKEMPGAHDHLVFCARNYNSTIERLLPREDVGGCDVTQLPSR